MNDSDAVTFGALGFTLCDYAINKIKERRLRRRNRRYKVRPINRARRSTGNFQYYLKMKNWDSEQFFKFTRMNIAVFDKLLGLLKQKIQRQIRSDGISPEERLVITLQYLSPGMSMQSLAWTFNVGLTTVHVIIHDTCKALWDTLSPIYLRTPTTAEDWERIAEGFENKWNFPHCSSTQFGNLPTGICRIFI